MTETVRNDRRGFFAPKKDFIMSQPYSPGPMFQRDMLAVIPQSFWRNKPGAVLLGLFFMGTVGVTIGLTAFYLVMLQNATISSIATTQAKISQSQKDLSEFYDKHFASVDGSLASLSRTMDKTSTRMTQQQEDISNIDKSVRRVDQKLESIERRMQKLEQTAANAHPPSQTASTAVPSVNTSPDTISPRDEVYDPSIVPVQNAYTCQLPDGSKAWQLLHRGRPEIVRPIKPVRFGIKVRDLTDGNLWIVTPNGGWISWDPAFEQ